MYHCNDCGRLFREPTVITEDHGLSAPPFERVETCPHCGGKSFTELNQTCRYCGARIGAGMRFCSTACEEKSAALFARHLARKAAEEPINRVLRRKAAYNRRHGTAYSYGQFVAHTEKTK